jgi:transcriptional regulator with XRE-family HTH domain
MPRARDSFRKSRVRISEKVRDLRRQRQWTQAELAEQLGLSQGRYSQLERGTGSFTAEQFLALLKLFNVPVSDFGVLARDPHAEVQNTLARLGAQHLQESESVLPSEQLKSTLDVIREALLLGTPRLLTGIAPVLVKNIDDINLGTVGSRMIQYGLDRRLGWLIENTLEAVRSRIAHSPPRPWLRQYKRAEVLLDSFLGFIIAAHHSRLFDYPNAATDVLDHGIRTRETLAAVTEAGSPASKRWNIVTRLQPIDFENALRAADPS